MKFTALFALYFLSTACFAQFKVENTEPLVSVGFKKILYYGYENPVYISAGSVKSLKVSVVNGRIKKTSVKGKYLIVPGDSSSHTTTVILRGLNYKKEIDYQLRYLPTPQIRFLPNEGGMRNSHGIPLMQFTAGIFLYHQPADIDVEYQVDSFRIKITDSLGAEFHYFNLGPRWSEEVLAKIKSLKPTSRLLVYDVWVTYLGKRRRVWGSEEGYFSKWD